MALRQMNADPLDSCLQHQEFSKIPTREADTRTTPYSMQFTEIAKANKPWQALEN
jgi:hypothetical protein